jgi:hypothetical protein
MDNSPLNEKIIERPSLEKSKSISVKDFAKKSLTKDGKNLLGKIKMLFFEFNKYI